MGVQCPTHNSYQRFVKTLTHDQQPAKRASDVVGFVLSCGCKFGNKDFMKIQEIVTKINTRFATQKAELEDSRNAEIAKALAPLSKKGEGN